MASVAIRLGTSGKAQVRADLDEIAASGDTAAKRHARAWLNAANDVETALARQQRAARNLETAMPGLNPTKLNANLGIRDDVGKSAQASASVFGAAYAQMEARAEALVRAVDPVRAAQAQFNATIGEARGLVAAGVMSLDDYVTVLRVEKAALDDVVRAHGRSSGSSRQMQQAMAGASYQVQDLVTQISMGANPINAFVVQGGQLAGQFMNVEGKAGAVARFLMGPWGLAIQIGLMALAPLVAKLFESGKASDQAAKSAAEHRKAMLDLADAQGKAIQTEERRQALVVAGISLELQAAVAVRERTRAELLQAQAKLAASRDLQNPGGGAEGGIDVGTTVGATLDRQIADLTKQLADNAGEIVRLQKGVDLGYARMIQQRAAAGATPEGAIRQRYDRQAAAAMDELSGVANGPRLRAKLDEIYAARDRELKAIEQSTRARTRDAETVTANQVAKMLRDELPGVAITSTTGGKHVTNSYHYRPGGQAVDFVPAGGMSSMSKDDVRRIFESRGIQIVELLGPGDKGHSDHFHVAWTKGKLALDAFTDAAKRARDEGKALDDALATIAGNLAKPEIGAGADFITDLVGGIDARREAAQGPRDYASGIVNDQRERLDLARADLALVGANDNFREAEIGKLRLILDLRGQGVAAGSDDEQQILANAAALGEIEARLRQQQAAWDVIRNTGEGIIDRLFDPSSAETWGDRVKGVLGDIRSELIKLALINPLKKWLYGDSGPSLTDVLGKLFGATKALGGGGSALPSTKGPPLASGTEFWSGGTALLGEFGPEVASLPRGTRVTPAGETRRLFGGANDTARGDTHYHFTGNLMTPEFWAQVSAGDDAAAMRGAAGGAVIGGAQGRARAARRLGRF